MRITKERLHLLFEYHPDGYLVEITGRKHLPIGFKNYGHKNSTNGYHAIKIDMKMYKFSSIVWCWHHGEMIKGLDHIDRDRSNNRIENLRKATHPQNCANKKIKATNKTGFRGVSKYKHYQKWIAKAGNTYLGLFNSPELAAGAYDKKIIELYGEFACPNFPQ